MKKWFLAGLLCLAGIFGAAAIASGSVAQSVDMERTVTVSYERQSSDVLPSMLDEALDNVTLRMKGCETCVTRVPIEPTSGYLADIGGDVVLEFIDVHQSLAGEKLMFYWDGVKFTEEDGPDVHGPQVYDVQLGIGANSTSTVTIRARCQTSWYGPNIGERCISLEYGKVIPGTSVPYCSPGLVLHKLGNGQPLVCLPRS